jgi:hypothetical protein
LHCLEIIKGSLPGAGKKDINRRARRDRRGFSSKRQKQKPFYSYFILSACSGISAVCASFLLLGYRNLSFSVSFTDEDRKMTEEKAENAEITEQKIGMLD